MRKRKSSTYSSNQISYTTDIVKEVIKREQWKKDYKKSVEVMEILFDYIAYQSKQDNVFSFEIPFLGTLYKPISHFQIEKTKLPKDSDTRRQVEDEILQIKRFSDINGFKTPHNFQTFSKTFYKPILEEYEIEDIPRKMNTASLEILSAIEDKQNRDLKIKR